MGDHNTTSETEAPAASDELDGWLAMSSAMSDLELAQAHLGGFSDSVYGALDSYNAVFGGGYSDSTYGASEGYGDAFGGGDNRGNGGLW